MGQSLATVVPLRRVESAPVPESGEDAQVLRFADFLEPPAPAPMEEDVGLAVAAANARQSEELIVERAASADRALRAGVTGALFVGAAALGVALAAWVEAGRASAGVREIRLAAAVPVAVPAPVAAAGLGLSEIRSPTAASQPAREGALPAQGELRSPPGLGLSEIHSPTAASQPAREGALPAHPARKPSHRRSALRPAEVSASQARGDAALASLRDGNQAYLRGDLDKAARAYRKAARLNPQLADARFGRALVAYEMGRDRQADAYAEQTLRVEPGHALGHLLAGLLRQERGERKNAAEHYAAYLFVEPNGLYSADVRALLPGLTRK